MLVIKPYIRERAVEYAKKYAFSQNPLFASFKGIGGNCTNFVSQCIYAGSCVMNYTKTFGWYYRDINDRTASWTGVQFFYNFMTENLEVGPFGKDTTPDMCEIGDVIQLGRENEGYYHTVIIVGYDGDDPLVAAQTDSAYARPLSTYNFDYSRYIKILGVRINAEINDDCFETLYNGTAIVTPESNKSKKSMSEQRNEKSEIGE